jgi:dTDP-4-dehydrorhamnose reductase
VFNGTKQFYNYFDKVSPTTNYGRYKVMVENFFDHPNFSTLRLTKVISKESPLIVGWENEILSGGVNGLLAYKNHFISPVTLNQVGRAVHSALKSNSKGIFQLGSNHEISYYDFALEYFSSNKKALDLIIGKYDPSIQSNKYNSLRTYLPG